MANSVYLCCSNNESIYPSSTDGNYDSKAQTVAMDVYAIPLFWLAAFRESDLMTQTIQDNRGTSVTVTSALCTVDVALKNLASSIHAIEIAFPEQGDLSGYASLLGEAISMGGFSYVTMEISELEWMDDPEVFQTTLRYCLRGFAEPHLEVISTRERSLLHRLLGKPKFEVSSWRDFLLQITDLRDDQKFPAAEVFLRGGEFTEDEGWNHCRLLGDSLFRAVPWMPRR